MYINDLPCIERSPTPKWRTSMNPELIDACP
jgi:hypothetical protein